MEHPGNIFLTLDALVLALLKDDVDPSDLHPNNGLQVLLPNAPLVTAALNCSLPTSRWPVLQNDFEWLRRIEAQAPSGTDARRAVREVSSTFIEHGEPVFWLWNHRIDSHTPGGGPTFASLLRNHGFQVSEMREDPLLQAVQLRDLKTVKTFFASYGTRCHI